VKPFSAIFGTFSSMVSVNESPQAGMKYFFGEYTEFIVVISNFACPKLYHQVQDSCTHGDSESVHRFQSWNINSLRKHNSILTIQHDEARM
jgi:hypothetical protein